MELTVKNQLQKEPNLWINKALTVLFVLAIVAWASIGINFSGVKEGGIDIAKNTHWASAMNSDGEILLEPFSFQNNNEGFLKFISKLSNFDKQKMLIGLESTAHYGENIISYLFNLDYKIGIINPIQTSNLRKSNIRKTKNDKVDTFIIIKSLTLNNYNLVTTRDINNIKLKGLSRSRHNLIVMRSRSKIQLASFID